MESGKEGNSGESRDEGGNEEHQEKEGNGEREKEGSAEENGNEQGGMESSEESGEEEGTGMENIIAVNNGRVLLAGGIPRNPTTEPISPTPETTDAVQDLLEMVKEIENVAELPWP